MNVVGEQPPMVALRQERSALGILGLTSALLQIPFLNRGISFYDEGSILAIADGLHNGELLYRDRVTLLPPLTYELMRLLFDLFGPHLLVGRILQAVVFVLCTLLIYSILRHFLPSSGAFLGALAFLPIKTLAFPFWTLVNYSQIAMLFSLATILLTLRFFATGRWLWLALGGGGVGMTVITKQNLGTLLAVTVAVPVALDALRLRQDVLRALGRRAMALLVGGAPPVCVMVALFAKRGTLGDLIQRVVFDLRHVSQLPPVAVPITYGSAEPGAVLFTYFPAALAHLTWQGRLDLLAHSVLFVSIGHAVQAAYVAPLLAMAIALVLLGWRTSIRQCQWSGLLLLLTFATTAYASMLYRADWTHLMNIAPSLLLLCAVVLRRLTERTRLAVALPLALSFVWIAISCLAGLAIFLAYDTPIETPRGRLFAPSREVRDATRVLNYVQGQSPQERILFFRADPLYYFLLDRRIPIMLDLVMPALLSSEDDTLISQRLAQIDQIIYNPQPYITLSTPVTDYVPQTTHVLATDFRAVQSLGPTAIVLKPHHQERHEDETVVDLWNDRSGLLGSVEFDEQPTRASASPLPIEGANWMMYRVLAVSLRERKLSKCIVLTHAVGPLESVSTIPLLNPQTWSREDDEPEFLRHASGAVFRVTVHSQSGGGDETLYAAEQHLGVPPEKLRLPLDRFVGQQVEIRFCAALPAEAPPGPRVALAGWAEPRIVRRSAD